MRVKDIFADTTIKVFVVTDQEDDNELNWIIKPTDYSLIPDDENFYFVAAKQVWSDKTQDCFIGIVTPERIAEIVVKQDLNGQAVVEDIYKQAQKIIPAIASNCFGIYELYYAKDNPQIGIDILRTGLTDATNKNVVAQDLGYILRDEGRTEEAIEAFKISEQNGLTSEYIFWELARLTEQLGRTDEQLKYEHKFKDYSRIN